MKDTHEPIIAEKLWDDAHARLDCRKRGSITGGVNIFAGLVKCDRCGYALTLGNNKAGKHYCHAVLTSVKAKMPARCTSYSTMIYTSLSCLTFRVSLACFVQMKSFLHADCKWNWETQVHTRCSHCRKRQTKSRNAYSCLTESLTSCTRRTMHEKVFQMWRVVSVDWTCQN